MRDEAGFGLVEILMAMTILSIVLLALGGLMFQSGRDMNRTGSWGTPETVAAPAKRFAVVYHLAHIGDGPPERVRLQVLVNDGEPVPTVVPVWPTADWHEREQFDLMGIVFDGHPNLRRLIMPSDWAGHPLRKDYPIGGEPVQFTDAV